MIWGLVVAAAAATAAPLSVFDAPAPVDNARCATMKPLNLDGFFKDVAQTHCCDSCHHPFLLAVSSVELKVVASDAVAKISEDSRVNIAADGSGAVVQTDYRSVEIDKIVQHEQTITVPCASCVTVDECFASPTGRLELWHHQCLL